MSRKISLIAIFLILLSANSFSQDKKINSPAPDAGKPFDVSYGFVVDNSGSYRMIMDSVIELVHNIVEENKAEDETFLVRFVDSKKIDLAQDFTGSKDEIHAAAEDMFVEGGQTAILDALSFSAKYLAENAKIDSARRKILVLITDGEDRSSKTKIEDVLKFSKDENIRIFTIGLAEGKVFSKNLNSLSKETGGKSYQPKSKPEISSVAKEIAAAMRAQ